MKTIKNISKTWVLIILFGCMFNLQAGKSVQFKMPDYEKVTIKNGITLYLLEQHEVPLIYISNVFKTGAIYDGAQNGLAYMTAKGLMFGTKNYSKSDIEETFDYIGASISTYARRESSGIDLSCAKTDLETIIPIWKEMITAPIFLQEEFEKNQKRHLMKLEQDRESPNNVIRSYYNKFIYDDQVYGNPLKGTKSSVSAFTVNDLKKFYKQNYSPANMVIIIAGDFNKGEMKKKVISLFEKWQPKNKPVKMDYGKEPVLSKSRVLLVNKEDSRQTTFFIGGMGIKRDNPDYTQIQVINTILGGRFTSWLNDELRVNAGLTYGARSGFSTYKKSGDFAMRTFTGTPTTIQAVDLALEVYNRLFTKGIDEKTLESAKNYMNGQFPPRYETAGELADLLVDMFIYDFDESYINDFQKTVNGMDVTMANEIIKKYFPKDNLQFVLIGKASEIREQVKKYGELTEKEIKTDGF